MQVQLGTIAEGFILRTGELALSLAAIGVGVRWLFRDNLDGYIAEAIKRKKAELLEIVDKHFEHAIQEHSQLRLDVNANKDGLAFVKDSVFIHGKQLEDMHKFVRGIPDHTKALEQLTISVDNLVREVSYLRGQWDGTERRRNGGGG